MHNTSTTYQASGVDTEQEERGLQRLGRWVEQTFLFRRGGLGAVQLPLGYFANVVDVGHGLGVAVSTDGVGTKALVAQMMRKFDTIGIDCVAMNVNDVLCVGAEPIAMLDYLAVETVNPSMLEEIAKGLYRGAELANITIPGGEIAQIKEMIQGVRHDGSAFDVVGTCIGTVPINRILVGQEIREGDVVVGLRSSGIHSNGLTLARSVLLQGGRGTDRYVPDLSRTIGEELLEPTRIYVREALAMLAAELAVKAFVHITSDGFLNLTRVKADVGYVLDNLPPPQPIFHLIQSEGNVADVDMYHVYNMGVGMCVVVAPEHADRVQAIARENGSESQVIGHAVADPERHVKIPPRRLIGRGERFSVQ